MSRNGARRDARLYPGPRPVVAVTKKERIAIPIAFRDALLDLARKCGASS